MRRFAIASIGFAGLLGIAVALGLSGCSQPTAQDGGNTATAPPVETQTGHADGHGDHKHGGMADMEKGLAELSETDRESAMKQHVCPVSGEMLGTMGAPIKLTVKDHEAWICCEGCKKQFEADPDKYLAKLPGHDADGEHNHGE